MRTLLIGMVCMATAGWAADPSALAPGAGNAAGGPQAAPAAAPYATPAPAAQAYPPPATQASAAPGAGQSPAASVATSAAAPSAAPVAVSGAAAAVAPAAATLTPPAAAAYATPYPRAAAPFSTATARPYAAPAPYATPRPTAIPSIYKPYAAPAPAADQAGDAGHVTTNVDFHPSFGLAVRGGGAMPLGNLSAYNTSGGMAGLDLLFQATDKVTVDLVAPYTAMPYTPSGGGGSTPLSTVGGAIKLDYEVFRVEDLSAWLGFGGGYMVAHRTEQVLVTPVVTPPGVTYTPTPQTIGGVALVFCGGAGYDFNSHWSLDGEIDVMSLNLSGGTTDSLLVAMPNLMLKCMF